MLRYPGGIHLAGGDVGDVVPEGDGDVAGRGGGRAEVDGDGLGDDHRGQDAGRGGRAGKGGRGPAASLPCKEGVGRNDHRLGRFGDAGVGRDHLDGGEGGLARKDLDAFDADGLVARLFGHEGADRVGADGGVGLVERAAAGRGFEFKVGGGAVCAGHPVRGKTLAGDGDADARHRGGLPGGIALDAQNSCCHSGCSFADGLSCTSVCRRGRRRVAKAPRFRGNPFLPAYAGQKFLPPNIPLGTKFGAEPCTRLYSLAHSLRQIFLYVSRPYAHVIRAGLFLIIWPRQTTLAGAFGIIRRFRAGRGGRRSRLPRRGPHRW